MVVESDNMGCIACHSACPHYDERLSVIIQCLENEAVPLIFYSSDKNHSNYFFEIVADPKTILPWTNRIDWKFVKQSLDQTGMKDSKQGQKKSKGYGFASEMCLSPNESINSAGISEPRKRSETFISESVSKHFQVLSEFSVSHQPSWLNGTGLKLWEDPDYPDRQQKFASQLVGDNHFNMLEAHYNGQTSPFNFLQCHTDKSNPSFEKPSLSSVLALSRTAPDRTRSCVIGAMRKSICDNLKTLDKEESFISCIVGQLKQMPDGLRKYNSSSLDALDPTTFVGITDFPARSYNCHLDPQSFYGVYKWYLPTLARRFRLSIGEMISVQTTFDCMAKSHYYFGVTAEYLLYGPRHMITQKLENYYRGFSFGYFILQMMQCVNKITSNPPSWFNDYKLFACPDYKSWDEACVKKTKVILTLWSSLTRSHQRDNSRNANYLMSC